MSYRRESAINSERVYKEVFDSKGVEFIEHHRTKTFEVLQGLVFEFDEHLWVVGDSLLKLSRKYYNNSVDWWIIGFVNGKPTDGHFKVGDVVRIPINPALIRNRVNG